MNKKTLLRDLIINVAKPKVAKSLILPNGQAAEQVYPYAPTWEDLSLIKAAGMVNPFLSFPKSYVLRDDSQISELTTLQSSPMIDSSDIRDTLHYSEYRPLGYSYLIRGQGIGQRNNFDLPRVSRSENKKFSPRLHQNATYISGSSFSSDSTVARRFCLYSPNAEIYIFEKTLYDDNYLYDFSNDANSNPMSLLPNDSSSIENFNNEQETNVGLFIIPESIVGRRNVKFGFCWGPWVVNMGYIDSHILDEQAISTYKIYLELHYQTMQELYVGDKLELSSAWSGRKLVRPISNSKLADLKELRILTSKEYNRCILLRTPFFHRKPHNEAIHRKYFIKDTDQLSREIDQAYSRIPRKD